jgi:hypothetical protein
MKWTSVLRNLNKFTIKTKKLEEVKNQQKIRKKRSSNKKKKDRLELGVVKIQLLKVMRKLVQNISNRIKVIFLRSSLMVLISKKKCGRINKRKVRTLRNKNNLKTRKKGVKRRLKERRETRKK